MGCPWNNLPRHRNPDTPIALYRRLELEGIVENADLFKKYLIVERNASNPNRLDVLFPPDYVNQLRIFAVLNQFRLQYGEE